MKICALYLSKNKLFSAGIAPCPVLFGHGKGKLKQGVPRSNADLKDLYNLKGKLLQLWTLKTIRREVAVDCFRYRKIMCSKCLALGSNVQIFRTAKCSLSNTSL